MQTELPSKSAQEPFCILSSDFPETRKRFGARFPENLVFEIADERGELPSAMKEVP